MRAITVLPSVANSARLEDVADPPLSDGSILVRTLALGVCGTDRDIIAGEYGASPPAQARLVLGHESLGRVHEAPADTGFTPRPPLARLLPRPHPPPLPPSPS